uniref:Inhibitor of nuclear factor kappa-B kinase subunit gamma n=1 Tax=Littorina littorea TaxID=31216 RepID=A0A7G8Z9W4_LITLI|nr:inhibitor of nuclear factor kappa-B kinase subunit gamma [Littorina littorea]
MNGPAQPGSQPASGGMNGGSMMGGFEVLATGMGGGAGVSPPCSTVGGLSMTDVTLEQALARMQELAKENADLREYLKENNEMMRKQFETLSQWKQKVHDANVMNREKFEQTRALITSLRAENEELQTSFRDTFNKEESLAGKIKSLEAELNTLKTAKAASDQLAYNVVKQAEQQGVEVGEEETQMRETVFVASAEKEERIMHLEADTDRMKEELDQLKERCSFLEHDNTQFRNNTEQLLKDLESTQQLKQQLQRENQDLMQETVRLRQEMQSMLAESKNSLQRNNKSPLMGLHHLQGQGKDEVNVPIPGNTGEGAMGRTPDRTVDDWQETSAAVTAEVEQLRKQLEQEKQQVEGLNAEIAAYHLEISQLKGQVELQKSELDSMQSRHEDRIRQLQKEHEGHVEHIERQRSHDSSLPHQQSVTATHAEDVQTLRSQVLTLINEVHETQNKLAAAQRVIETKSNRVRELETYSSQIVEDSRNRLQQLQQTAGMGERQLAMEQQSHAATKQQMNDLRLSFNQLVSDYKDLLDTFDQYKAEQEQRMRNSSFQQQNMDTISHLTAQVLAAEEAINIREERIQKMQQELKDKEETVGILQAQADVYKCDFTAERDARTQLATEKDRLCQELESEQLKNQGLADQLTRYTQQQLQDMQLRASQGSPAGPYYPPQYAYPQVSQGYLMGGGGDGGSGGGGGGQLNNLSGGEGLQAMAGQNYGGAGVGGQNYPRQQNYGQAQNYGPGQNYGRQNYGQVQNYGQGQNYAQGQIYAAVQEGYPQAQVSRMSTQATTSGPEYGNPHAPRQQNQGGGGGGGASQPSQHDEEEHTLYICPSCDQRLPDLDTLTIHVQDCLDQHAADLEAGRT